MCLSKEPSREWRGYNSSELSRTQHCEFTVGGENSCDPQRIAIVGTGAEEWGNFLGRVNGISRIEQV